MTMITAYLDESETPNEPNGYFVVAGLATETLRWKRIERDWQHVLDEFGLKSLHMKKFAHSQGLFRKLSESKRRDLLGRFSYILASRKQNLYSASCAVSAKDYKTISEGEVQSHPYLMCLQQCASNILKLFERGSESGPIHFVFDERHGFIGKATEKILELKTLKQIPKAMRDRIGTAIPGDDRTIIPLQAADLLAYELNKHYRDPSRKRVPLDLINPVRGEHTVIFDQEEIIKHGRPSWA